MTWCGPAVAVSKKESVKAFLAILLVCLILPFSVGGARAESMTDQELLGRKIYLEGKGRPESEITAAIGEAGMQLPAAAVPCGNCHGDDGLGRPEGGVRPSNIIWANLTKPYGHRHQDGRQHPSYDEASVAVAIADGVDPAGNRLDSSMPRYRMSDLEMAALIAYMKRLESDLGPGLSATSIRVGTVLPLSGNLASLGLSAQSIIRAYFEEINAAGGIYGRTLELIVADYGANPGAALANARHLVEEGDIFAAVGVFPAGAERDLFTFFEDNGVPDIGPFTLLGGNGAFSGQGTFFLVSGLTEQSRALVDYAALKLDQKTPGVGIVLPADGSLTHISKVIERQGKNYGWAAPLVVHAPRNPSEIPMAVSKLRRAGVQLVYYFGPGDSIADFAREAAAMSWFPYLFLPGVNFNGAIFDIPPAFDKRLFIAYPTLPSDQTAKGRGEYEMLRAKYGLPKQPSILGSFALASSKLLVEGLRNAGKSLTREKFVAALESLEHFETGFTPIVRFDRSHRVGARGAYVLPVDLNQRSLRPPAIWIPVSDTIAASVSHRTKTR